MLVKTNDMKQLCRLIFVAICAVVLSFHCKVCAQTVTPFQYGLTEAQDPVDVYRVLLRTHQAADSCGCSVSYTGIDTLRIAVPPEAQSIPLQVNNDFGGTVFVVTNNTSNIFLFRYTRPSYSIPVGDTLVLCRAIDSGNFKGIPMLAEGDWLLHIVDSTPWVDCRRGYQYGHYREDIMRVRDGISHDTTAMPYNAGGSRPSLWARRLDSIDTTPFTFTNITLMREPSSTNATYLLQLDNLSQATLRNIVVVTPRSNVLAGDDAIIYICNSTNVVIDSLTIWGTYSRTNHSGYGLLLGNLRNTRIRRLKSLTDWGVFGTNNMTETTIEYSEFNRFDIHCYGRNVTFDHCLQRNGFNQFSSVFGDVAFRSCTFDNFTPVYIEDTYNAYTNFVLTMDSCQWRPTAKRGAIFVGGRIDSPLNSREELQTPAFPDIIINNLDIYSTAGIRQVELFHLTGSERRAHVFQGPGRITLRGVNMQGNPKTKIILGNKSVNLLQETRIETPDIIPDTTFVNRIAPMVIGIGD